MYRGKHFGNVVTTCREILEFHLLVHFTVQKKYLTPMVVDFSKCLSWIHSVGVKELLKEIR